MAEFEVLANVRLVEHSASLIKNRPGFERASCSACSIEKPGVDTHNINFILHL